MIIVNCEQGSDEWHQARAGCITASMFCVARERMKVKRGQKNIGDATDKAMDYAFMLAMERISGKPLDESFETWQMKRGHELEPQARAEHEVQTGLVVMRAGFVMTEDGKFGGSADGLIGEDGGSEYKCLVAPEKLRSVLLEDDFTDYLDQVQGCMWLTGREWWHFCLYCPALESIGKQLYCREVRRDEAYIEQLEEDLLNFEDLVSHNEMLLRMKWNLK